MPESRSTRTRPVWISASTREFILPSMERQLREVGKSALANDVKHLIQQYDTAPADSVEVCARVLAIFSNGSDGAYEQFAPQAVSLVEALGGFPLETT